MAGRHQPYPIYKPSGVEWLGAIPETWELKPCRATVNHHSDKNSDNQSDNYLSLMANVGVIPYDDKGDVGNKKPDDLSKCKIVRVGDLVINSMNYAIGSYGMSTYDGICSPVYIVLSAKHEALLNRFALRVFENKPFQKHLATFGNGILAHRAAIGWDTIKGQYIPVPPIVDQEKILRFLDHETAKIDELIAKQECLIALLKEKRQAVISHAVTKGLNPDAPLRPSGIDWLGDVPAHWAVKRGKHLFEFVTSGSRGWAEHYTDEGALFFRITNLTRNTIRPKMLSLQYVSPPKGAEGERSKIAQGDLLISITADLGSICVADERLEGGYVSQHVALCRPSAEVSSSDWLGYAVLSDASKLQLLGSGYGGTKIQLSLPDLRELLLAKPPHSEQLEIAKFLDKKLESFAQILDRGEEQITLLKERRTALISAAVTGKIDVRNWQPPTDNSDQDTTQKAFA